MRKDADKDIYTQFYLDNHIPLEEGAKFAGEIRTLFTWTGIIDSKKNYKRDYDCIIQDQEFEEYRHLIVPIELQTVFMYHYDWGFVYGQADLKGETVKQYVPRL